MKNQILVDVVSYSNKKMIRFFYCFVIILSLLCFCVIAISIYSNHWGYFGDYGQFILYNDRKAKVEYLKTISPGKLPQAFVLGSSDMMPFQPKTIKKIFGYETFNFSTFWGRVEDMWSILNFILYDIKQKPKMIIIGLEPWTFSVDDNGLHFLKVIEED